MDKHKNQKYDIPEEITVMVSEPAVAYAAIPPQTHSNISTLDALWTLIESQDENTKGELRYRLDMLYANKEALRLDQELEDILHNKEYKAAGMTTIPATTVRNVRTFINACPNENILQKAMLQPRMNGTLLLDWYQSDFEATVNIDNEKWSFGILGHSDNKEESGDASCSDKQAILLFYNKINRYIQ